MIRRFPNSCDVGRGRSAAPRGFRPSRLVPVLIASIAFVAVIQTAAASPPTDLAPLGALLPNCVAGAPDTQGAHICWVTPLRPSWQASTGEWIVVRIGDAEPVDPANPGAAQSLCEQMQASVVATITLDGQSLLVDTIPCAFRPSPDPTSPAVWFVDWRALSPPLTPGEHTFSANWFFTTTVDGNGNAGQTVTFPTSTLTVMPQG